MIKSAIIAIANILVIAAAKKSPDFDKDTESSIKMPDNAVEKMAMTWWLMDFNSRQERCPHSLAPCGSKEDIASFWT